MTTTLPSTLFGQEAGARAAIYQGVETKSHYLTMRDGIKIAVDICTPKGLAPESKIPAILIMARYWRSFALRMPDRPGQAPMGPREPITDFLVSHGYAVVLVDVRGSGASFGTWEHVTSATEKEDMGEVAAWVAQQPWCSGNLGAVGISYEGSTAELLAAAGETAVKAIVPQETEFDLYTDIVCPGGILNQWFIEEWNRTNHQLDRSQVPKAWGFSARLFVKGVRPVAGDTEMLEAALAAHKDNPDVYAAAKNIIYRGDPFGDRGVTFDEMSQFKLQREIAAGGAAIFGWGSWLDGNTANAVLHRFLNFSIPQVAVIGGWSHNMKTSASPYTKAKGDPNPTLAGQWSEVLRFFDYHLLDKEDPRFSEKMLYYYTLGKECWQSTETWPPAGFTPRRCYLGVDGKLTTDAPTGERGSDQYTVDFAASTGKNNRWHTPDGMTAVVYGDRAKADKRLLTYTGEPLPEAIEITGHPLVTLYVNSTATDGAFFIYLEEVDPRGKVTYITEGQLRALHRKIAETASPYQTFGPYHSYKKEDSQPLVPGETAELTFALQPTSVVIPAGHRLRLAIAGHDKDTFARIPTQGILAITVMRNALYASYIELPVK